jgi:hypothetical protein
LNSEPLWTIGGITAAFGLILALATAFGFHPTPEQSSALKNVEMVLAPPIAAWIARRYVYNRQSVEIAVKLPKDTPPEKIDQEIAAKKELINR